MANILTDKTIVGVRQSLKAIRHCEAESVYLASDASADIVLSVIDACRDYQVSDINRSFTMSQLGQMAKIDVGAAVIVIKK